MNKIKLSFILLLMVTLFSGQLFAQTGYTYTLIDNGSFSYSVVAVPDSNTSNFNTSVQSYGFTLTIPNGGTIATTFSLGGNPTVNGFAGTAVGFPDVQAYLVTELLAGTPIGAPSAVTNPIVYTFQVDITNIGTGLVKLIDNQDLDTSGIQTNLQSFMNADTTDDGSANFPNIVPTTADGVSSNSGIVEYPISSLSTPSLALENVSLYPNPATSIVNIKGLDNTLTSIELYNLAGQKVLSATSNLESINISQFQAGVYIVKLNSLAGSRMIKLVKKN